MEGDQADAFAAVAEREYEEAGAPVAVRLRIAHQRARAVVDLRFFTGRRLDDGAGFRGWCSATLADEAFDALVAAREAVIVDQILVDGLGVAALAQRQFDEVAVGLAST